MRFTGSPQKWNHYIRPDSSLAAHKLSVTIKTPYRRSVYIRYNEYYRSKNSRRERNDVAADSFVLRKLRRFHEASAVNFVFVQPREGFARFDMRGHTK